MQELVQSSEQYLTQQERPPQVLRGHLGQALGHAREGSVSDSECSFVSSAVESDAPPPGQLKHSDSLLLLTQVGF